MSLVFSSCQRAVHLYDRGVKKTYTKNSFESKILKANNHTIHYFDNELKDKPVLLFIHGFGGDGKVTWERQVKEFSTDFRVIVPDLLWFGESFSEENPSLLTQVDAIKSLISHLELQNIHLVGISYGGFVGLSFASEYELLLKSLIIVSSPGNVISDEEVSAFCKKNNVTDVKEIFIPKDAEAVKRLFDISMVKPPRLPMVFYEAIHDSYFSKYPIEQAKLLDDLPSNKDKIAKKLTIPVLIMWGKKDEIFSVDNAYKLQKMLQGKLIINPTTGHTYPGEDAKHFNAELRHFLQSLDTISPSN